MSSLELTSGSTLKQQIPWNLAGNVLYFTISLIIGLSIVPFFISTLGIAVYGLIVLAASLNGYVGLFTQSLNAAISRYLTVDLQREDYVTANKTFNTAFFGISGVMILMIPVALFLSIFAPTMFDVPSGQETGVIFLFLGVIGAFLICSWSGNFTVSLFAYNRLDLLNLVNIVNIIVQVLLIVTFFSFKGPSLALVGLAYLIGGVAASVLAIYLSRRINPHLKINILDFDRSRLRDLTGMGWWVIVNQVGATLIIPTYPIVVNIFFGATSAGEFSIALQWVILLYAIAGILSGVFTPIVFTYYARKLRDELVQITKSAVKFMGLAMALPIGLICGFGSELLTIWVGEEYSSLALLIVALTIPLTYNLAVIPFFSINIAYNQVKLPGIATFFAGVGNILLAVAFALYTDLGYYGVAIASAVVLLFKNGIFIPWYTTRLLGVPARTFNYSIIAGVLSTIIIATFAYILSQIVEISGILPIAIASSLIAVGYLGAIWSIGLNRYERDFVLSYLPKRFSNILKFN